MKKTRILVEVSARHIHLSQKDLDKLFGQGYKLKKLRDLSQLGQFAAEEKVVLTGFPLAGEAGSQVSNRPKGRLNFRVVGPVREESQIEISKSEADELGIQPPLRLSGDLKNVKTKLEVYPVKSTTRGRGAKQFDGVKVKVILVKRHLHVSQSEAKKLNLKNNQAVKVQINNIIFDKVIVRPGNLACHLDIDETNTCGLGKVCGSGYLIK